MHVGHIAETARRDLDGQVFTWTRIRWLYGQVFRWSGAQVVRWSGGQVLIRARDALKKTTNICCDQPQQRDARQAHLEKRQC